MIIEIKLSVVF